MFSAWRLATISCLSLVLISGHGFGDEPIGNSDVQEAGNRGAGPLFNSETDSSVSPSADALESLGADCETVQKNLDPLFKLLDTDVALSAAQRISSCIRESLDFPEREQAYVRFHDYVDRTMKGEASRIPRHQALRVLIECRYFWENSTVYSTSDISQLRELLEDHLMDPDYEVRGVALEGLVRMGFSQPELAEEILAVLPTREEWWDMGERIEEKGARDLYFVQIGEAYEALPRSVRQVQSGGISSSRTPDSAYRVLVAMSNKQLVDEIESHTSLNALSVLRQRRLSAAEAERLVTFGMNTAYRVGSSIVAVACEPAYLGTADKDELERVERVAGLLSEYVTDATHPDDKRQLFLRLLERLVRPGKGKISSGEEILLNAHFTDEVLEVLASLSEDSSKAVRGSARDAIDSLSVDSVRK